MSAPTPGPWYAKSGQSQMCSEDTTVAMIGLRPNQTTYWWIFSDADEHGDAEPDARLMAAAPDLLHALRALLERTSLDYYPIEQQLARDAIARATGDTPCAAHPRPNCPATRTSCP